MKNVGGFIAGLGVALLAFNTAIVVLKLAHREPVCVCLSRLGR